MASFTLERKINIDRSIYENNNVSTFENQVLNVYLLGISSLAYRPNYQVLIIEHPPDLLILQLVFHLRESQPLLESDLVLLLWLPTAVPVALSDFSGGLGTRGHGLYFRHG